MKYLILLLLFITSCTDKKQTTEPTVIESEPIIEEIIEPPKIIKLSYDKGLDLILVDSDFERTISRILENYDEGLDYNAIYWDSNNNQYYTIENDIALIYPIPVTHTNFIYTIDETKQYEPIFDSSLKEIFPDTKAHLLYIGDLSSPLERVYLDPTNQQYYIKNLKFFDTSFHISYDDNDNPITNIIDSPVFPVLISNISTYYDYDLKVTNNDLVINTYFTNTNNQILSITFGDNNKDFVLYYSSYINDLE